jgi:hypothetical protein
MTGPSIGDRVELIGRGGRVYRVREVGADGYRIADGSGNMSGPFAAAALRVLRPMLGSYGGDVDRFNAEHGVKQGCSLGRVVGSDVTECQTHGAWVSHGVPSLLRDI